MKNNSTQSTGEEANSYLPQEVGTMLSHIINEIQDSIASHGNGKVLPILEQMRNETQEFRMEFRSEIREFRSEIREFRSEIREGRIENWELPKENQVHDKNITYLYNHFSFTSNIIERY